MLTLTRRRRAIRNRITHLPEASHRCEEYGVWVRRGVKLVCRVCGADAIEAAKKRHPSSL